jgi:rRNA biogenesis protein RRP5
VGQQVHGTVIALSDGDGKRARKRIDLSLRLRHASKGLSAATVKAGLVLPVCVRSEEDHGYMLTLGVKGLTGFMRKKDCKEKVVPGMMLDAMVISVKGKVTSGQTPY